VSTNVLDRVVSIDSGDHRAAIRAKRDALVKSHLFLVRKIAEKIARSLPPSFDLDDLIATGNVALVRAANQYRPDVHGETPFDAYARPIIHGRIIDSIRRNNYAENTRPSIESAGIGERHCVVVSIDADIDGERRLARVRKAIEELPDRMRRVLEMHYEDGLRFAQIAELLNVHPSRASQIHIEAIQILRANVAS